MERRATRGREHSCSRSGFLDTRELFASGGYLSMVMGALGYRKQGYHRSSTQSGTDDCIRILTRKPRMDVKVLPLRDGVDNTGMTHIMAQGTTEQARVEASRFRATKTFTSQDYSDQYGLDLKEEIADTLGHFRPMSPVGLVPWDDVLKAKKGGKSPGEPWLHRSSTYDEVLEYLATDDKTGLEVLKEILIATEYFILSSEITYKSFTFYVQSKLDGYNFKKVATMRYRTVQCADMVTFFITKRYLGGTMALFYEHSNWMHVMWNPEYLRRTMQSYSKKYSAGWDVTAMDGNVCASDISDTVDALEHASCKKLPNEISRFLKDYNAFAPLVFADGTMLTRGGGNPSGTYLTTMINCFTHYKWMRVVDIEVFSPENELTFQICGDDNLHSVVPGTHLPDGTPIENFKVVSERVQEVLLSFFGISIEYEESYFNGTQHWNLPGSCACFLDYFYREVGGVGFVLPRAPYRRCRGLFSTTEADCDDATKTPEVLMGIKVSCAPYYAMRYLIPIGEELPRPLIALEALISDMKVENPNHHSWASDFTDLEALETICLNSRG